MKTVSHANSAYIALQKCLFYRAKQALLICKIGYFVKC